MSKWTKKLFIERSDLFLKLMNLRWPLTEGLANGMTKILSDHGITSGSLLDLCCGNGRVSIHMAKKGFKAVGIDISQAFIEDAKKKARESGVAKQVTFLKGDARRLGKAIGNKQKPFDVVVNAWTAIGYSTEAEDLAMFKQARELSRKDAILFVAETMHTEYLSIKFIPTSYAEFDNMLMLEDRKYNPITATINTIWTFYEKHGKNLKFTDKIEFELHTYSPTELAALLRKAGWETTAFYGSLSTLQPMTPLTSMNLIAKAA